MQDEQSGKRKQRVVNIGVDDVHAKLNVELIMGKKKKKAAVDLVMGIVEGEMKKNVKHET